MTSEPQPSNQADEPGASPAQPATPSDSPVSADAPPEQPTVNEPAPATAEPVAESVSAADEGASVEPVAAVPLQPQPAVSPVASEVTSPDMAATDSAAAQVDAAQVDAAQEGVSPESLLPEQASNPVVAADQTPAAPSANAGDAAAMRIREKMAEASAAQAAVRSEGPRPENPATAGRVEIPGTDDLDASLEEEIQAAMAGAETPAPAQPPAEASAETGSEEIGQGSRVKGTVQQIHEDDVFLDAGLRHNVVVSLKQFPENKPPAVGDQVDVFIDEMDADGLIRGRLPRGRHKAGGNWDALAVGQVVDCVVGATNKGGLQVTVSNLRAFLPASQIEIGYAGDLEKYVGQKLTVQITEVNPRKRNLVVSRRALLQAEREESEGEFWTRAEVGQEFSGTVKTIKDYGAFINIGAVDGFLHIGEISWSRINHPSDVLQEGQQVDVKVLKLDTDKKRISLGMKQLAQNPWASATEKYSSGRTVSGKVTRLTDFGAFIELEPGLEGMVHISQLAWRRVGSVGEILSVGETRDFQVQEVDTKRKRVSLSLKALEKRPESAKPEPDEDVAESAPEPRRPRNPNLRGGRDGAGESRGGLFGNPADFS
ncbi:MAG: S1 RNA-binding domain-containing protein [Planctomycetaceae bacterium]|nr:S1 RNA-binding domain-containing protein [Planctomycetaceae bacterium]